MTTDDRRDARDRQERAARTAREERAAWRDGIHLLADAIREGIALYRDARRDLLDDRIVQLKAIGGTLTPEQAARVVFPNLPAPRANNGVAVATTTGRRDTTTEDGLHVSARWTTEHFAPPPPEPKGTPRRRDDEA